ncbi:hypothetical protein E4U09_001444, partial [Claviceps aff. purpurea]
MAQHADPRPIKYKYHGSYGSSRQHRQHRQLQNILRLCDPTRLFTMSRYGTANGTATPARHPGNSAHGHHERQPLLGQSGDTHAQLGKCRTRMIAEVSRSHADLILLLCYIVTGLLDSASIQVWGSFVSMQT